MKHKGNTYEQHELDNYSQQLNPNDEKYWKARQQFSNFSEEEDEDDVNYDLEDDGIEPLPPGGYLFDWD